MLGDMKLGGKRARGSTTKAGPEFKKKKGEGQAHVHVAFGHEADSGSKHKEVSKTAKRAVLGAPNGTGKGAGTNQKPAPYKVKNSRGQSHKVVPPKDNGRDSGLDSEYGKVAAWVSGKRNSYK